MYRIDLLRHGETELSHTLRGSTDDALTNLGWQQMQQTVDQYLNQNRLQPNALEKSDDYHWQCVLSSPLERCRLFAEHMSQTLQVPLACFDQLQEMHFGAWEAVTTAEIYEKYPEQLAKFWQSPTQYTPPQAESLLDFHKRVMLALKQIHSHMQLNQYDHALVVTHGGVIKLLKCLALQQPLDDILKMKAELGQLNAFILHDDLSLAWLGADQ